MKKYIVTGLSLLVISSCTLGTQKSEFASLYDAHVGKVLSTIETKLKDTSIFKNQESNGDIQFVANVPNMFSGSLHSGISALENGINNSQISFLNPSVEYTAIIWSGSLKADEISLITSLADSYVLYKGVETSGLISEEVMNTLKAYEWKWLDASAQERTSQDVELAYRLMNLSRADIEKYLTTYRFFTENGEATQSGDTLVFNVDLDKNNILSLAQVLTKDFSGTGMTQEETDSLKESLASIDAKGTLAFKSDDALYSDMHLSISQSGAEIGTVQRTTSKDTLHFILHNTEAKTDVTLEGHKTDEGYTLSGEVTESGVSLGKLDATMALKDGKLQKINMNLLAQGMNVSLVHEVNDVGFEGTLTVPMGGKLTWKGTLSGKELTALMVDGNFQGTTLNMNLTKPENGDLITGPFTVKNGDQVLASALVGLQIVGNEKFGLTFDKIVVPGADMLQDAHFGLFATGKNTPTQKKVEAPKNATPLSELLNKLNALQGTSVSPDMNGLDTLSGDEFSGSEDMLDMTGIQELPTHTNP